MARGDTGSSEVASTTASGMSGFLGAIERLGNKVPHPAIIFFWLIGFIAVLSAILAFFGAQITYEFADIVSGEVETRTTEVRSLLSADGLRFVISSPVANFMGFGAVGVIIVAMVGVGVAEESGLIAALVRKIVRVAPQSIFTFIIVMLGVVSSIAADAGYLVLVPLGAAAFHSLGRHPLAGLAAAFLGVAAVFLVNIIVTPNDALLVEMTNDAIALADPIREITLVGNLWFMIASSIIMAIICTIITERLIEPRLGPYEGGATVESSTEVAPEEAKGLRNAGIAFLVFAGVLTLLTAPANSVLRNPETGGILTGSPFMSGLIVIISALFFTVGYWYGKGAGTIRNMTDALGMVTNTLAGLAGLILLLLVISQFVAFFSFTNMATVLAATLAEFLVEIPVSTVVYLVAFVIIILIIDILLTGAVAKWAIFAPVFVPLFMQLGKEPDLVLAAYRVGDSPMNVITPLNVYLVVMVGFAAKYVKDAGIGTIVSLMLPYTVILSVVWTLMLVAWYLLGLPLGPV